MPSVVAAGLRDQQRAWQLHCPKVILLLLEIRRMRLKVLLMQRVQPLLLNDELNILCTVKLVKTSLQESLGFAVPTAMKEQWFYTRILVAGMMC